MLACQTQNPSLTKNRLDMKVVIALACADPDFSYDTMNIFGSDQRLFLLSTAGITEKITDPIHQEGILYDIEEVGYKKIGADEVLLIGHSQCKWIGKKYKLTGSELDKKQIEFLHQAEKIIKQKTSIKKIQKVFLENIKGLIIPQEIK